MYSLTTNALTEKTLAAGLTLAVDQHDAEAAKEESSTVGRGTHTRQVKFEVNFLLGFPPVFYIVQPQS